VDGGVTWSRSPSHPELAAASGFARLDVIDARTCVIAITPNQARAASDLYVTHDAGQTLTKLQP
jgi:hypothetical protein